MIRQGLSQTRTQAAEGRLLSRFHVLFAAVSPKQQAISWFCSRTVDAPANSKPLHSHGIASKPQIVRRAVWNERKPPTRGIVGFTRKWLLSIPCCRWLVT